MQFSAITAFIISHLTNPWVIFGFIAQAIFFLRFIVQWAASEKEGKTIIPTSFWHLSIIGAVLILIYAIYRNDIVFIAGQGLALLIYIRNIVILQKDKNKEKGIKYEPVKNLFEKIFLGALATIVCISLYFIITSLTNSSFRPTLFSSRDTLNSLWNQYKTTTTEPSSGRTVDAARENISTSEGQSYTMLRAVWSDDEETFEQSWKWTKDNLLRDDWLFSWLFGDTGRGTFGVLTKQGGNNSASDGDVDIALALVLAHARWQNEVYLDEARAIINAIWEKEIVEIKGVPYLAANDLEKRSSDPYILINPSYLAPYAYRIFAKIDTNHNWQGVVDSSYKMIEQSSKAPLDTGTSAWLPPNWVEIHRVTGALRDAPSPTLTTDYSFDALRTPWRIALDWKWFGDERAKDALRNFHYLSQLWEKNGSLPAVIGHDGTIKEEKGGIEMYATALPYFMVIDPENGEEIFAEHLLGQYNRDKFIWKNDPGYYGANWGWFGFAYYYDSLPNYAQKFTK